MYNNLFKKYTPESVYWQGLLTADGYISKKYNHATSLGLKTDDDYLVKNFATAIGYKNTDVTYRKNKATGLCIFETTNKSLYYDLINLGLMHKKSRKLGSDNIPNVFFGRFLNGVFDGDGTACLNKRKFVCAIYGHEPFLFGIKLKLKQGYDIHSNLSVNRLSTGVYCLSINRHIDFKKIYNLFYNYDFDYPFMKRKKEIMDNILCMIDTPIIKAYKYSNYKTNSKGVKKPLSEYFCNTCNKKFLSDVYADRKFCSKKCCANSKKNTLRAGGRPAEKRECKNIKCNIEYICRKDSKKIFCCGKCRSSNTL